MSNFRPVSLLETGLKLDVLVLSPFYTVA